MSHGNILSPLVKKALDVKKTSFIKFGKLQQKAAISRVLKAMSIPGKSGDELAIAEFIRKELLAAGAKSSQITTDLAHKKTPLPSKTGNLIFTLPGKSKLPRRVLMAHMDTVPICAGCKPKRDGNIVRSTDPNTGLGADDRAGVATVLTAALEILKQDANHPPLTFLWTIQEEIGLHGARLLNLNKLKNPKYAFNWDGGSPAKMTIGATGGYRMEIVVTGKASHAGNAPEAGVSAIAIAALAIADLQRNGWHGDVRKGKKRGTTNIGFIQGGEATNVVTDRCVLKAEARSHDPVFRKKIVSEVEKAFRRAAREVKSSQGKTGSVTFDGRLDYESFAIPTNSPVVLKAQEAIEKTGLDPELAITNGGLDANWLNSRGLPTVSMGCGQRNQHMVTEALHLDEYLDACRVAIYLAQGINNG